MDKQSNKVNDSNKDTSSSSSANPEVTKFTGTWGLESSSKFDDYMKAIGVNKLKRTVASKVESSVEVDIRSTGNHIEIHTLAPLKSMSMYAKLDQRFKENTPDGRVVDTIFYMDGPTMIQEQVWDSNSSTIIREITPEGKLRMTMSVSDVTCQKTFFNKKKP